jgi:hypothetical protein
VDIDGVINAVSLTAGADPDEWAHVFEIRTKDGRGPFLIRVPRGTRERLELLEQVFDMVWATTWMDQAAALLCPRLGIGLRWPFIDLTREIELTWAGTWETETWKLPGIERWAKGTDRPIAWLDDDLGGDAERWARGRSEAVAPTVLVPTDPSTGLSDDEVGVLLSWARSLSEADER